MIRTTLPLALALSLTASLALADAHAAKGGGAAAATEEMDHSGMDYSGMDHASHGDASSPMTSYMAAMGAMADVMPSDSTGDADADFLRLMIPHHQSAVDMARIVLEIGDDPEVRALAEAIVASQEAEILAMQEMLAAMDVQPGGSGDGGMVEETSASGDDAAGEAEAASE